MDDFLNNQRDLKVYDPDQLIVPRRVIGQDDRNLVPNIDQIPFRYVVQILASSQSVTDYETLGSGFLIGENLVATAAHNLFVRGHRADRFRIYFLAHGSRSSSTVIMYQGFNAISHPNYNGGIASPYDVATIRIHPSSHVQLPSDFGYLRVVSTEPGQLQNIDALLTGYPDSVPVPYRPYRNDNASQYYHFTSVLAHSDKLLYYYHDTTSGQSGAPIIVRANLGGMLGSAAAGIHLAGGTSFNAGVPMEKHITDFLFPSHVA